jgi:ubiquinone/menaquinone biosynthesis C-methylase UbiE
MSNSEEKSPDEIKEFYETTYYGKIGPEVQVSAHLRRLAGKIGIKNGQKVLDVACGVGEWLSAVNDCGGIPSGIDLSEKAIDICRRNIPGGDFIAGPAESLPFPDNNFAVVSCLGALEHFVEPDKALQEMARVAKDDAIFIFSVPNKDFLTRRLGLYEGTHQHDIREIVLSLEEWEQMFNRNNLKIKKKWRDLHVLSWRWISSSGVLHIPVRLLQALALAVWPLSWQYQVYMLCMHKKK